MHVLWYYGLSSFQAGGTKLERFLPKNQHRKLLNFGNWINGKGSKIWLSKSIFYVKNHRNFSHFFFIEIHQFSKFTNFLQVCWFLGKNLCNFVPPAWKLDNPYYHNVHKLWKTCGICPDNSWIWITVYHKEGHYFRNSQ